MKNQTPKQSLSNAANKAAGNTITDAGANSDSTPANHPPTALNTDTVTDTHTDTAPQDQGNTEIPALLPIALDYERYRDYLQDCDLSHEQQNEWLETIWNILKAFVDMGFGLDAMQLFPDVDNDQIQDENTGTDSENSLEINNPVHKTLTTTKTFCSEAQAITNNHGGQQ